jgi:DUF1680 family protein
MSDRVNSVSGADAGRHCRLAPVPIGQVVIEDEFWSPKIKTWREVTIGDCFAKFESDHGGAIDNFDLVRDGKTGSHAGPPWYDGLIYEMITGAADFMAATPDPALEARIDGYVARISAAQARDPNGYVNTFTQTMAPQSQRWGMNGGDDVWQHDLYNAGMMLEAGVHYYLATGHAALLEAATKMANLMCDTIGPPPKANAIPGHSGPEYGLVQLFRLYRDHPDARRSVSAPVDPERYLALAQFFIDARGNYEGRTGLNKSFGYYGQDHAPLAQQRSLEGHAVRATLFCTGIAAVAYENGRVDYLDAALRFWDSLVRHRMYVTGAAGSIGDEEKFGPDYVLPNDGYMETCAAVGGGLFNGNMNLLFGEARYVDELERALYNAVLGGTSLAGHSYYYQNPLIGRGRRRWEWHGCPCCPPMFLKMMGALPGMIYAQAPGAVYVNLFAGSRATLKVGDSTVRIRQSTRYPWDGAVRLEIDPDQPADFDLFVRIPGWCEGASSQDDLYRILHRPASGAAKFAVNGRSTGSPNMARGYAHLRRTWKAGDVVELHLDMPVRPVRANSHVAADGGLVALTRGPLVYCVESIDNGEPIGSLFLPPEATYAGEFRPDLLGGVEVVHGRVGHCTEEAGRRHSSHAQLVAVPFYASANREPCSMRVWLAASEDKAAAATLAMRSRASASHCWELDSASAINDGVVPAGSSDTTAGRLSWWDHKGTAEWVELEFPHASAVSKARVYWFADRPANGGCDVPASWRLFYREGDEWRPVEWPSGYGVAPDKFNEVTFTRVTTTALRIEVQLQPGWSGGICEWQVE